MFLVCSCSCICAIYWSQLLSREWRCSWSSVDRRCSNYIWVIDNFIAYYGASYIRGFTVTFINFIWTNPNFVNSLWLSDTIMVTEIWVNIGSGNGLLPDGTKPLNEPMLTDHQWSLVTIYIRAISQKMPQPSITKICLKITCLKFHLNFPGANELIN